MGVSNYELMVIANPKVDSEAVLSLVDRALKEASATSVKVDRQGRKLLAYPIGKQTEGEYMVFNFEAEGGEIAAISGKLRLAQEEILRYLITRVEESKRQRVKAREEPKVTVAKVKVAAKGEPRLESREAKAKEVTKTKSKKEVIDN